MASSDDVLLAFNIDREACSCGFTDLNLEHTLVYICGNHCFTSGITLKAEQPRPASVTSRSEDLSQAASYVYLLKF